jgi:hypothetical protein
LFLPFVRWQTILLPKGRPSALEWATPASIIFVGFGAIVLLTDVALAGVLLGLGSFVVLMAIRLVNPHDHR